MSGMTTRRIPYTNCYFTIRWSRNSKWQRKLENSTNKIKYIKPRIEEWKIAQTIVGTMRLNQVSFVLDILNLIH